MPDTPTRSDDRRGALRLDGLLENLETGLGVAGMDQARATRRVRQRLTPAGAREEYRGSWAARREIDRPAEDIEPADEDWEITGVEGLDQDGLKAYMGAVGSSAYPEDRGVLNILSRFYGIQNMVGGGAAVMIIEDGLPASEPVDFGRIRNLTSIEILERDEITPIRTTTEAAPEFYLVGTTRTEVAPASIVHASRVILGRGARLSPRDEYNNQGWGASALDALLPERTAMHAAGYELGSIALKVVQDVVLFSELSEALCEPGGEARVMKRIAAMASARSQHKIMPLDGGRAANGKERARNPDQFVTAGRDARGVADVLTALSRQWAGGTGQTPSIALGDTPGGLNTGENAGDWRSWSTHMDSLRLSWLLPRLKIVLDVVFAATLGPTMGVEPASYGVKFSDIYKPSQEEEAAQRASNAATDAVYAGMAPALVRAILEQRFVDGNTGALSFETLPLAQAGREELPGDVPDGEDLPPGEDVPETDEVPEPTALDLAWTNAQPPPDAMPATDIADALGVTSQLVHRVAKDYQILAYPKPGYPKTPLYSLQDMKGAFLQRQGVDVAALDEDEDADA